MQTNGEPDDATMLVGYPTASAFFDRVKQFLV
jgi:hypothetical protein